MGIDPKKIVVFRLGSIGDTMVSVPHWYRIVETFPDAERILLTNVSPWSRLSGIQTVLPMEGFFSRVIAYPTGMRSLASIFRLARELRATQADTLIYLAEPRSRISIYRDALFFRLCGFSRLIGLPFQKSVQLNRIDPDTGEEEPECERLARQIAALGPVNLANPRHWDICLGEQERSAAAALTTAFQGRAYLAINMGGKDREKDWGEANWRALLRHLSRAFASRGHSEPGLLIVGGKEDVDRAETLAQHWHGIVVQACAKLSVRECAAALEGAQVFVGHDSGPLHLAASRGVRCVGLYGTFNRRRKWHPYGQHHHIFHPDGGLNDILPEDVSAAVLSIWDSGDGRGAAA